MSSYNARHFLSSSILLGEDTVGPRYRTRYIMFSHDYEGGVLLQMLMMPLGVVGVFYFMCLLRLIL